MVAGGNGEKNQLNQLTRPTYRFIDEEKAIYVSGSNNHRLVKLNKGLNDGIVVAGRQGSGSALTQLSYLRGLLVDRSGTSHVTDHANHGIIR